MDNDNSKKLTPEKLQIYEVLQNMLSKALLLIVALLMFCTLFYFFIRSVLSENYIQATIFGTVDGIFAYIIIKVYNHYFGGEATKANSIKLD